MEERKVSEASSGYTISRTAGVLVSLLVIALIVMNAGLVLQNRKLKKSGGDPRTIVLNEGKLVPSLSGVDINGNRLTLDYGNDHRRAVVLVFSPHCSFCTKNMPNWTAIAQGLDRKAYRIIAVSILSEGIKEYVAQHELKDVPIIAEVDPKSRVSYEMTVTPQTILIDYDGKVEKVWTGFIQANERNEVERTLGIKLPVLGEDTLLR
jgi:peroxiredoxin